MMHHGRPSDKISLAQASRISTLQQALWFNPSRGITIVAAAQGIFLRPRKAQSLANRAGKPLVHVVVESIPRERDNALEQLGSKAA
jgi:hypothetical protein